MIENGNMFQNLLIIQRNTNLNYFCKMYRNEANKDVTLINANTSAVWRATSAKCIFAKFSSTWRGSVSVNWCTEYTEEKVGWTRLP